MQLGAPSWRPAGLHWPRAQPGSACSQAPLGESWAFLRGQQGAGEGARPQAGASLVGGSPPTAGREQGALRAGAERPWEGDTPGHDFGLAVDEEEPGMGGKRPSLASGEISKESGGGGPPRVRSGGSKVPEEGRGREAGRDGWSSASVKGCREAGVRYGRCYSDSTLRSHFHPGQ